MVLEEETIMPLHHRMDKYCSTVRFLGLVVLHLTSRGSSPKMGFPCMTRHYGTYTALTAAEHTR